MPEPQGPWGANKPDPWTTYAPQPTDGYPGGITPEPAANHAPAPKKHHAKKKKGGGDGGLNQFQSMFEDMMAKYDKLLDAYLNPETPEGPQPGMGFEGTVLSRRVLDEDKINAPGLFPVYGGASQPQTGIQQQVMDPVTGATYATPDQAMMAGVTNWKYVPLGQAEVA